MTSVILRREGGKVLAISNGQVVLDMPWRVAEQIGRYLIGLARLSEEESAAERIAYDQALVLRVGAPFGLTNHPVIRQEAEKLAQYDRDLRRYLPGGVKSQEHFGTPGVVAHPPKKEVV